MVLVYFQYSITVLEFARVIIFIVLAFLMFNFIMLDWLVFDFPILLTWKVEHQHVLIHQNLLNQLLNHRNSLIYFSKNY